MGVFDGIKKGAKKVVKGVKKVFKKVVEAVGKVLNSKLGKAIMLAATVVTGGMALYGAFSGMTGALSTLNGTTSFLTKFTTGARGFLSGAMNGMKAAGQMMGQGLTGNFAGAKETLTGLGQSATNAGINAVGGVAKQTINTPLQETAKAAGEAAQSSVVDPSAVAQGKMPTGSTTLPGAGEAASSAPGGLNLSAGPAPSLSGADASYVDQFKGMLQEGMKGYEGAGNTVAETFGAKLKDAIASPEGLLAVGKMGSGAAKLWAESQAAEDAKREEEKAIRKGWTRDPNFNPGAMFQQAYA